MIGFGNTPVRFGQGMIFGGLRREAPGYSPQPLIHPESGIDANPYIRLIQQYEPKGLVNPAQDVSSKPYINPAVDVSPKSVKPRITVSKAIRFISLLLSVVKIGHLNLILRYGQS